MKLSRYNYIHLNKLNITIGVKGTVKTSYTYEELGKIKSKIISDSADWSNVFKGNSSFPQNLGLNREVPKPFESDFKMLEKAQRGREVNSWELRETIQGLVQLSEDKQYLHSKLIASAKSYYGVENMDTGKFLTHLAKGDFKISKRDSYFRKSIMKNIDSDPTRLQDWILHNVYGYNWNEKIGKKKRTTQKYIPVNNHFIRKIDDIYLLREMAQGWSIGLYDSIEEFEETIKEAQY